MGNNRIKEYAIKKQELCKRNDAISNELFDQYGVNRGLRDINGKGVLTGLTSISKMVSFKNIDGVETPCEGELWYRGYNT
ncbi:MAG: citrate synthase, partial [Oscillospiraceae bacterium]|nr:citrate synthase [Oscillospiraceae bacterium]